MVFFLTCTQRAPVFRFCVLCTSLVDEIVERSKILLFRWQVRLRGRTLGFGCGEQSSCRTVRTSRFFRCDAVARDGHHGVPSHWSEDVLMLSVLLAFVDKKRNNRKLRCCCLLWVCLSFIHFVSE